MKSYTAVAFEDYFSVAIKIADINLYWKFSIVREGREI